MKTKFILIAAAALTFAACSNDSDSADSSELLELRLTSGVQVQTRAAANTQESQIVNGETVYVWVDDNVSKEAEFSAVALTSDGSNGFTGSTLYFPQSGEAADIYAFHGNFTTAPATGSALPTTDGITFSVSTTQNIIGGTNYTNSDLLYAAKQGVARTTDPVTLTFYHMLSKLELAIKIGEGAPNLSTVTLGTVTTNGTFTPVKTTEDAMETQSARAAMVTAGETTNNITLGSETSSDFSTYNEAIIVPQSLAGKTLTFTLENGGEMTYTFPTGTTFESGKKYRYHITLSLTGIDVISTIYPWDEVAAVEGDAKL